MYCLLEIQLTHKQTIRLEMKGWKIYSMQMEIARTPTEDKRQKHQLTGNRQVVLQIFSLLFLQLISHVFQDGIHFGDGALPTL